MLIVVVSLGVCLFWQNKILERKHQETVSKPQDQNTPEINLSEDAIQRIIDGVVHKLKESGKEGNAAFGVFNKHIIPTRATEPRNLYVNWKSGRILNETKDKVTIKLPDMHGDIGSGKNFEMKDAKLTLYKRVGNKQCPFDFGNELLCAEVVGIEDGVTVVRVSIVKSNKS